MLGLSLPVLVELGGGWVFQPGRNLFSSQVHGLGG